MTSKTEILTFLKSHKLEFKEKFGVQKIGLFGSYARNEATENSDIDLVVEMPSDFNLYYDFKYFLEDNLYPNIDLGLFKTVREQIKQSIQNEIIYV
jgi:predicted nucleotidyltransferase